MKTTASGMSSSLQPEARGHQLETYENPPTAMDVPIDAMPFSYALKYGVGVMWAQRRFARDVINARLTTKLDAETNRLALTLVACKALDQSLVTKFVSELWQKLMGTLGQSVTATEAEMRVHIQTLVGEAYAAIKRHNKALEDGDLPPNFRDRLVAREEARTDKLISRLDAVLDELIDMKAKLMTDGISLPSFVGRRK